MKMKIPPNDFSASLRQHFSSTFCAYVIQNIPGNKSGLQYSLTTFLCGIAKAGAIRGNVISSFDHNIHVPREVKCSHNAGVGTPGIRIVSTG